MRYDAAIIGAGAEGLVAAALLGRAGLRALVIERSRRAGGRACLREFHPGFKASPFADEIAAVPASLYWSLDLARFGAVIASQSLSCVLWPDRSHVLAMSDETSPLAAYRELRAEIVSRVQSDALRTVPRGPLARLRAKPEPAWPGATLATRTMSEVLTAVRDGDAAAHLAASALEGRSADPVLPGSALHLLGAGATCSRLAGGPARLAEALEAAARAAGAEFALGLEATDILRLNGRIVGVGLADNSQITASRVISTLDLKRTFLTFFPWNALPKPLMRRINAFRMAGATARVLFALETPPTFSTPVAAGAALHIAPALERFGENHQAWRQGLLPDNAPVTLREVSRLDPSLAHGRGAVVTATIGDVPFRPFDGAWTHEKRETLRRLALRAAESVAPGFAARVLAAEVVAPPDIEDALGASDGDLLGGELAGDQMLGCGPWDRPALPRTPVEGLYLAGSYLAAGAFATGAAGAAAAEALMADLRQGRPK